MALIIQLNFEFFNQFRKTKVRSLHLFVLFFMCQIGSLKASEVVEFKPVTNKILMVRFDDGYVVHHKKGEMRTNEEAIVNPLDVAKAMLVGSYSVSSNDDPNYATPLSPDEIGRKSKPTEFALMCQSYNSGCINSDPDHVKEHWLYLFLPHELLTGKSYDLVLDNLSSGDNSFSFVFDETKLHSEVIHVNNIGYSTHAPAKYAYLYHWMGDKGGLDLSNFEDKKFKLYDTVNEVYVYSGDIKFRSHKTRVETGQATDTPNSNFSSADVYECDFSEFNEPGSYKIVVEGIGSSFGFDVDPDVYREAFYWTMKGLYHNRSGMELKAPHTNFPRQTPHHPIETPGFNGRLKYSSFRAFDMTTSNGSTADKDQIEVGYKGELTNTYGWYQDAGDWDGYYTHTHVPAYLMFLYEAGPDKFSDGELNIPESGNGIPDLLDEALWLLRYFKRAKDEIEERGWGTGGVPGSRVFGDLWGEDDPGGIGQGSWEDTKRDWYVLGEDPWTTFKYAALTAQMAFILHKQALSDPEDVDWKLESIETYNWALQNTISVDEDVKHGFKLSHMRFYAAASLYRLTGEKKYLDVVLKEVAGLSENFDATNPDEMFGAWMYLLTSNFPRVPSALSKVESTITQTTNNILVNSAENRACRWGGDFYFPMLVGQGTTPMITPSIFGYLLNKSDLILGDRFLKYMHTTADYFLGCNPLNITWISGVAERYPKGVFHLDWWYADKTDPNNRKPVIEGVVPYGPWRYENLGPLGWWNPNWAYADALGTPRIYPESITIWPGHERWFDMRVAPLTSEFTIHQNTVVAAFVYGFLVDGVSTMLDKGSFMITELDQALKPKVKEILIYANPANEFLIIESTDKSNVFSKVEFYNLNGQLKYSESINFRDNIRLDVRSYAAGVYIVKVYGESKVHTNRIIIQK